MLRRLGIRGKVLAALAVPVLVLFAAATLISWQSIGSARVARSVSELVSTADELSGFARATQTERLVSLQANSPTQQTRLASARAGTDAASARLKAVADAVDVVPLGSTVSESLAQTTNARATLPALRGEVDAGLLALSVIDSKYTSLIQLHVGQAGEFADALADRELARYLSAYGLVGEAEEQMVHELPVAMRVVNAGGQDFAATLALAPTVTLDTAAHTQARMAVNRLRLSGVQLKTLDSAYFAQRLQLSSGSKDTIATISPAAYEKSSVNVLAEIADVSDEVIGRGAAMAASKESAAVERATTTIVVTIASFLLSILIALLVAREIVVPLRRLTKAAGDLRAQLPTLVEQVSIPGDAPELSLVYIPVNSRDEVGRLATAFNEVNATTIQVAQEQAALRGSIAEMFVNVARRDQVLLNRQISFIDALERSEEDPSALANLFRLDHLATRMRRNAESLLVLAGIDSGRRMRRSMPLSDVIRTASSEIEQYDRIQLELGADPEMFGFNSLAAAHLLAELMENATVFSEPETRVEVETSSDGEYMQVVVRDFGLGMSDADLEAATEKIRSSTASDVLGAQRLGFYVVGRLAARLAAVVTLARNPGGTGTIAVVRFPASLFEASDQPLDGPRAFGAELLYTDSLDPSDAPSGHVRDADVSDVAELADAPVAVVPAEAPAGDPIDLEALTDGETSLGLPRRRARAEGGVAPSEADLALPADDDAPSLADLAPTATSDDDALEVPELVLRRDERDIVLPDLDDPRLSLELAAELAAELVAAGDWSPEVSASDSAEVLPSRATVPAAETTDADLESDADPESDADAEADEPIALLAPLDDLPVFAPVEPTPEPTRAPVARTGLFAGFRGRIADAPPAVDLPALDTRTIAGAHADTDQTPDVDLADPVFVIPGFMPDDEELAPVAPAAELIEAEGEIDEVEVEAEVHLDDVDLAEPWAEPTPPVAAAPAPQYPGFTAFNGYADHSAAPVEPLAFEPTLNEARAWGVEAPAQPVAASWLPAPEVEELAPAEPVDQATPVNGLSWIGADVAPWTQPAAEAWTPVEAAPDDVAPLGLPDALVAVPDALPEALAESLPDTALDAVPDAAPAAAPVVVPADEPRARRGLFGRRRTKPVAKAADPVAVVEAPVPDPADEPPVLLAEPAAEPVAPARASAWHTRSGAHAAVAPADHRPPAAPPTAPAVPRWMPQRDAVEPTAFVPSTFVPSTFTPAASTESWSARPWSEDSAGDEAVADAEHAVLPSPSLPLVEPPRAAPGALDDEVAAMLAMRSDIQEQALAELGQLSTYRPSTVGTGGSSGGSLQRRVPSARPAVPEPVASDAARPVVRDADQLRARLSSFQSGTDRGRRDALDQPGQDQQTDPETTNQTPASTW